MLARPEPVASSPSLPCSEPKRLHGRRPRDRMWVRVVDRDGKAKDGSRAASASSRSALAGRLEVRP